MNTTEVRLWYVKETKKEYCFTRKPPGYHKFNQDLIWVPKGAVTSIIPQPGGMPRVIQMDSWLARKLRLKLP